MNTWHTPDTMVNMWNILPLSQQSHDINSLSYFPYDGGNQDSESLNDLSKPTWWKVKQPDINLFDIL